MDLYETTETPRDTIVVAADERGTATLEASSWVSPDVPPPATPASLRGPAFAADVMVTTLIPLSLGPELSVELPGRVLAQVHLGWMPELYSNAITGALEDAGV